MLLLREVPCWRWQASDGSPRASQATVVNVLIVMLGGLWHGAHVNFVTWGALNGVVLVLWIVSAPSLRPRGPNCWAGSSPFTRSWRALVSGRFPHCMERIHRSTPPGRCETAQVLWQQLGKAAPNPMNQVWSPRTRRAFHFLSWATRCTSCLSASR